MSNRKRTIELPDEGSEAVIIRGGITVAFNAGGAVTVHTNGDVKVLPAADDDAKPGLGTTSPPPEPEPSDPLISPPPPRPAPSEPFEKWWPFRRRAVSVTKKAYNIGDVLPDGWVVGPVSPDTGWPIAIEPAAGALDGYKTWSQGEHHATESAR